MTDRKGWKLVALIFVASSILDLLTTIRFFNDLNIHTELHPGIRLFGYAYGRTIGPILGKGIQLVTLFVFARLLGKAGFALLLMATVLYTMGAIANAMNATLFGTAVSATMNLGANTILRVCFFSV